MGLIIEKEDFVGKYSISQNTYSTVDSYIAKYEELYLIDMLGVDLFNLFKEAVTDHEPSAGIYKTIFDAIREDDGDCIRISEGIKEMLLGFIYWEYMRDDKFKPTPDGIVAGQSENNRETTFEENNIYGRYNQSVKSYKTIQWYIGQHSSDYPEFNGRLKQSISWI